MKFKTKEEVQEQVDQLGIAEISTSSSMIGLAKMGLKQEGILTLNVNIKKIEAGLWAIVVLALIDKDKQFKDHLNDLSNRFNHFIDTTIELAKDITHKDESCSEQK